MTIMDACHGKSRTYGTKTHEALVTWLGTGMSVLGLSLVSNTRILGTKLLPTLIYLYYLVTPQTPHLHCVPSDPSFKRHSPKIFWKHSLKSAPLNPVSLFAP